MSIEREFTFPNLERITPDLTGAERLSVFLGLPISMQNEAWQELGRRIESQSRARFAEDRLGGWCTPQELADEIEVIWGECRKVPLGGVHVAPPIAITNTSRFQSDSKTDIDLLRTIPSGTFVPLLTGREVTRGFIQCPFHAGGAERTPSLHVGDDQRWYCHACQAGGDLIDFYAALRGQPVPTGGEFMDLVRDLARDLGGVL
jgi:CHC2 zinc finger